MIYYQYADDGLIFTKVRGTKTPNCDKQFSSSLPTLLGQVYDKDNKTVAEHARDENGVRKYVDGVPVLKGPGIKV